MGRRPTNESFETLELSGDFRRHRLWRVLVEDLVDRAPLAVSVLPLPQVAMQADAEAGVAGELRGLLGGWPANHQGCAGQDSVSVAAHDAGVDRRRAAEV